MHDYNSAESDLKEAIRLDPKYETIYYYTARLKYAQNDDIAAIDECNKGIVILKTPDLLVQRGLSKDRQKDYSGSIADFSEAISMFESFGAAYYFRALSEKSIGKSQEACADVIRARKYNYRVDEDKIKEWKCE